MTAQGGQARRVRVPLGERAYDVVIGPGPLDDLPTLLSDALGASPRFVFAVMDENAARHAEPALDRLTSRGPTSGCAVSVHASETDKSLETTERLLVAMAERRLERSDLVLAIGGGIVGDVAGFAAAIYRRGVPVIQCPTTLLAMVDASVGGKTGVNLPVERDRHAHLEKNIVGAFHQPALVIADTRTLSTLPDREFRSGLAECVKHGLLSGETGDPDHLGWIEGSLPAILARDPHTLVELISRSVAFKAAIVAGDERELDAPGRPSRALLNLGHTFAHAIETIPALSPTSRPADAPLLHGEAVALGLVAAASAGEAAGSCGPDLRARVGGILERCGLPTEVASLPAGDELIARMGADKKSAAGRLRVVLPTDHAGARVVADPERSWLSAGWDAIRAG